VTASRSVVTWGKEGWGEWEGGMAKGKRRLLRIIGVFSLYLD